MSTLESGQHQEDTTRKQRREQARAERREAEQAQAKNARWHEIRAEVAKIVDRVENGEGLLRMAILELQGAQRMGDELLAAGVPRLPPGFDGAMLNNLISRARVLLRELTTYPRPLELTSPLAQAREFGLMILQCAPPEESTTETSSEPAQPASESQ